MAGNGGSGYGGGGGGGQGVGGDAYAAAGAGGAGGNGGNGGAAVLRTGAASISVAAGGVYGGVSNMNNSSGFYNSQLSGTSIAAHSGVSIGN
ncbi:hypothetical protein MYL53_13540 [Halomonas sp. YJPS3-2]|nr:hypothetical protein [Halomonas getboli]